jgi:hypothetical protein
MMFLIQQVVPLEGLRVHKGIIKKAICFAIAIELQ